jgi:uncharacterized protein (TIGR02145 family)
MARLLPKTFLGITSGALLVAVHLLAVYGLRSQEGTLRDVDGNVYRTEVIGSQLWMTQNLNAGHYSNGDPIPEVRDPEQWLGLSTGAWCYYENDPANGEEYGRLYNWYAVSDPRGLAPEGWHVPTDDDWKTLEATLGMQMVPQDAEGWFGTDEGNKLKSASGWNNGGNGSNGSGFSALPGGLRGLGGNFYQMGNFAVFWSSSDYDGEYVWYRMLSGQSTQVRRKLGTKMRGFSVRYVKNEDR